MAWANSKVVAAAVLLGMLAAAWTWGVIVVSHARADQTVLEARPPAAAAAPAAQPGDKVVQSRVSVKMAPPVVVATVPQSGKTDIDAAATTELKVTYSKDMADGTWSWSTWGEENFPKTTGKPRYLGDKRTCVLPVKLERGRTYAIWLNSDNFGNFKDTDGRKAVPYLLIFETKK
ncbi:MAG TPA: Ig-like domain-containing protein [Tepidisphaeraceae bacterium]|nr:Ig-like domain-containing protein [Tepidisphaeraceae bacterium]